MGLFSKKDSSANSAAATAALGSSRGASPLKGGKVLWGAAITFAILIAVGMFILLSQVASTTTYYVLNQDVAARTQITTSMLSPVVTSKGGEPRNALTQGDFEAYPLYSKYSLTQGDVLSKSNVGFLEKINTGVPATNVTASFQVAPERAVAGRIVRGDYIDIIAIHSDEGTGDARAKYVLRNVIVLDVNSNLSAVDETTENATPEGENATSSDTAAARAGVPTLYTVSLSPQDAAKLAVVADNELFVVLSPPDNATGEFPEEDISVNQGDVFGSDPVGNSGEGTDPSLITGSNIRKDEDEEGQVDTQNEETQSPAPEESTDAPVGSENTGVEEDTGIESQE